MNEKYSQVLAAKTRNDSCVRPWVVLTLEPEVLKNELGGVGDGWIEGLVRSDNRSIWPILNNCAKEKLKDEKLIVTTRARDESSWLTTSPVAVVLSNR